MLKLKKEFAPLALFSTGGHTATVTENGSNIHFYLFSILNYITDSIMVSFYSGEKHLFHMQVS